MKMLNSLEKNNIYVHNCQNLMVQIDITCKRFRIKFDAFLKKERKKKDVTDHLNFVHMNRHNISNFD